jgi:UDP-N-acetyl-D-glucosamine dehydrogenase
VEDDMLEQKIKNRTSHIAVLGLGHVGYPLVSLFAMNGFPSVGHDINKKRLDDLNHGKAQDEIDSLLPADSMERAKKLAEISKNTMFSNEIQTLRNADVFIVAVPTPLRSNETPNLVFLEDSCKTISQFIRKDTLVIIESTIYPGATEEIVKPILETSKLLAGKDFYLCFSPERIDPGSKNWSLEKIPKIVGGVNDYSRKLACLLYSQVIDQVVPVSSLKVAEATKMLENLFRSLNIALINELAKVFEKMEIDLWETIEAAGTKPFGFLPHFPGPGVGGHCIPKDPFYLLYKARRMGLNIDFVAKASEINRNMPFYVIFIAEEALKRRNKKIGNSSFGILGATYKKDVADVRRTPAKVVISELQNINKDVTVFDPFTTETFGAKSGSFEQTVKNKDCIILLVDHSYFVENGIEQKISEFSPNCCLIDTRNFINQKKLKKSILYRCLGKPPPGE